MEQKEGDRRKNMNFWRNFLKFLCKRLEFLKKSRFLPKKSLLCEKKQVIFVYIVQYRCGYMAKNLRNDGEKTLEKSEKV